MMPSLPPELLALPPHIRQQITQHSRAVAEACAKVCEGEAFGDIEAYDDACGDCAAAIREMAREIGNG